MNASIGIVLPSPEMVELAREVARESGGRITVLEGALERGVEAARRLEAEGVEVIISRAPTGAMIRRAAKVPVILIDLTPYDLVTAFHHASQVGRTVAFVGFHKTEGKYDFPFMEQMLGIRIIPLFYKDEADIGPLLERAASAGAKAVVGTGACIIEAARARNMRGFPVKSSREAIREAIEGAREVVRIRRLDEESAERLRAIIDFSSDGVVAVDERGRVAVINPFALRFLGLDAAVASGCEISRLCREDPGVAMLVGDCLPVVGELVEIQGTTLVVNRVPVRAGGEDRGYVITFTNAKKIQRLEQRIRKEIWSKGLVARFTIDDIAGSSPAIVELKDRIRQYAPTDATVLITGETGTGKELVAQSIHNLSGRSGGPFVAVNCAALPESLLESELFGYAEGAFTGARKGGKPGLFELAHDGSVFLDEIGEISPGIQSRLLRVIQEREVMRIGDDRVIPVNVRIIAATNHDLRSDVEAGGFRRDLFYRLDVLSVEVPALRERKGDAVVLANLFLSRFAGGLHRGLKPFAPGDSALFESYAWPGNVRELENVIERYATLAPSGGDLELLRRLVAPSPRGPSSCGDPSARDAGDTLLVKSGSLEDMRKDVFRIALDQTGGNCAEAARRLGISRTTAWRWLKQLRNAT
ncbi:MAG: sigma 54-interacting transcriptional regulator [Ignavibacteriales bacterium]